MSSTLTLHRGAADELAANLPVITPLTVLGPTRWDGSASQAITATFVGAVTADLVLVLTDREFLAAAGGAVNGMPVAATAVLRPAMESAAAGFGSGVLGELREEDAAAVLADAETIVYELSDGGTAAGWFAVRVRNHAAVSSSGFGAAANSAAATSTVAGGGTNSVAAKLGRINNVEMALTVEIGRTRMSVRDALNLEPGNIVELDRAAGAPADVLLNGRLIAHGEVVVVDQDYAVRITRILDVAEGLG